MAGTSLLTLLDDIATILDDVALMTKAATKKTAGLIGDDLAVNAEQVTGVEADRELPVVWAVFKGSALNKVILVPAALILSAVLPMVMTPLLMAGGTFLCFEGAHKVLHKLFHKEEEEQDREKLRKAIQDESVNMVDFEKEKIKGAVRTDFILSAEIIVIALNSVVEAEFMTRVLVLTAIAAMMTVGVYGLVAGLVKLDDFGLHLSKKGGGAQKVGDAILTAAPYLMRLLGIAGTVAMFLVGGDILLHGIPGAEAWIHSNVPQEGVVGTLAGLGVTATTGIIAGLIAVGVVTGINKARGKEAAH